MKPATTGKRIVLDDLADNEHALRQLRTDGKYTRKALLARAIDAAIAEAVKAEREAAAKVADAHANRSFNWASENAEHNHAQANWAERIAAAIRERGNP